MSRTAEMRALAAIIALYLILAGAVCATMYIWSNEAWFASPAVTLVQKGYLGTTIFETKGTWLDNAERHTYWLPPVHPLLQAAWYKLFGFSLLKLRAISVFSGVMALLAWFVIFSSLSGNRAIALLAIALAAIDTRFLIFSAIGRADMTCAALGSLGLAAYVVLRGRSMNHAAWIAHSLAAASCLAHPCGVLYAGGLIILMLHLDRHSLGFHHLALVAAPYLAAAGAWGLYILQAPSEFMSQFEGNVSGIAGEFTTARRWSEISSPLRALKREYFLRYGFTFGWYEHGFVGRLPLLALLTYTVAVAGCVFTRSIRNHRGYRALLMLGAFNYLVLAWGDGLKGSAYLVHTLPICCALLAIYLHHWFTLAQGRRAVLSAVAAVLIVFVAVQITTDIRMLIYQPARWDFQNSVAFLQQAHPQSQIIAPGEFAFALGFGPALVDDLRLGYFSGKRPEFIATNVIYRGWFDRSAALYPEIHRYMMDLLATQYRVAFHNSSYTIYQHIPR